MTKITEQLILDRRVNQFREFETRLLTPARVYCKRQLTDDAVLDPVSRCKYMTYVGAAEVSFMTSVPGHSGRQFDLSSMQDLEEMYYAIDHYGDINGVVRYAIIHGCMDLIKEGCYKE
jgi:hypothetical protein